MNNIQREVRLKGETINPQMRGKTGVLSQYVSGCARPYLIILDDPDFSDPPQVSVKEGEFEYIE